jgi:hypothetical protein
MEAVDPNLAVLVGNGLSIAFNPDLNLQSITQEVLRRVEEADGGNAVSAMRELAENALPEGASSDDDFEVLVGALGVEGRNLNLLSSLARIKAPTDAVLGEAISTAATFVEKVHDAGVSFVLEVISERSHAYRHEAHHLFSLVEAITTEFGGRVTFGNLNYDTLLLAAMLEVCPRSLADMGDGRTQVGVTFDDGRNEHFPRLRESAKDFPTQRRVRLLHLHGSLTFWHGVEDGVHLKIPKDALDNSHQWLAVREGTTDVRPTVVLASQPDKARHVTQYPFSVAYEMFDEALGESDHWLVIGYSFRDEPVNSLLRSRFMARVSKPRVLVVTHGDALARDYVERAFGWGAEDGDATWLTIDRQGANGAEDHPQWEAFTS